MDRKAHWENIYNTKELHEVSWYQPKPEHSLSLIASIDPKKDAKIIDVGGGDGYLVDHLLEMNFSDIHVLDISKKAIERAQERLGNHKAAVQWHVSDVVEFAPQTTYDIWHDRAAFHFLTDSNDVKKYKTLVNESITTGGYLILGTFSKEGPTKCSGIEIQQYNIEDLADFFAPEFKLIEGKYVDHGTPFDTVQNFTFVVLEKM